MPRKSIKDKFKSEAEEADWHTSLEGRRQTQREFARALRSGTLTRSRGLNLEDTNPAILAKLMQQAKENATRAISLRIPIADLERAKRVAEKSGIGYQTVLKRAIHEGLRKSG